MITNFISKPLPCSEKDFESVKNYIQEFELDDRSLVRDEFLVLKEKDEVLGFGRVRRYQDFSEMCSLGIITKNRNKGLGKILSLALIESTKHPLYLVCIIPNYFENLGFSICKDYPIEMQDKLNYCTNSLVVEEPYVVMKLTRP